MSQVDWLGPCVRDASSPSPSPPSSPTSLPSTNTRRPPQWPSSPSTSSSYPPCHHHPSHDDSISCPFFFLDVRQATLAQCLPSPSNTLSAAHARTPQARLALALPWPASRQHRTPTRTHARRTTFRQPTSLLVTPRAPRAGGPMAATTTGRYQWREGDASIERDDRNHRSE